MNDVNLYPTIKKNEMKKMKSILLMSIMGIAFSSCGEKKEAGEDLTNVEEALEVVEVAPNIVEVAVGNADFSTLVAAVSAAGLVETLSGEGPFTVFAPTNAAFDKLPAGTVESLLEPANLDQLTAVLTYHVVAGKFEAAAVIDAINANNGSLVVDTVQGGTIALTIVNGNVTLTDANGGTSTVVIADVAASNGVIHAIDTVVLPK
jgi:uncharacterized surface protein with fasciclin (FAS1) repeats